MVAYNRYRRGYRKRGQAKTKITNNPVKKAIKKYRPKKYPVVNKNSYIANNRNAIMTLSRQVKSLQLSQLGPAQKKSEWLNWDLSQHGTTYPFDSVHPMGFCLNQFIGGKNTGGQAQNSPLYMTNSIGNGTIFTRFVKWQPPAFQVNSAVNAHWSDDDLVSPELYKPLGTSVLVELQFHNIPVATPDMWIRFDIVAPKKRIPQSLYHELVMPFGLGQFTSLAKGGITSRNTINTQYWDIRKTIWVKANNDTGANKSITKYVKINRSYRNSKPLRPDLDASPAIGGNYPTFDMMIDSKDLEWLVISCGDTIPNTVKILRHMTWRDQHGTSA